MSQSAHSPGSSQYARSGGGAAKKARSSAWLRRVLGALGAGYIWFCYRTTRWAYVDKKHFDDLCAGGAFVGAAWHSRLANLVMIRPKNRAAKALISNNKDGDVIARICLNTGCDVIRGSSQDPRKPDKDKGGLQAMRALVRAARDGDIVVATPDGPRGPRMRVKAGVVMIAAMTRTPLLPMAYSLSRAAPLKSWDRFLAPLPFSRGVWVFGAPIPPADPRDPASVEETRQKLEDALMRITRQADTKMGRETPDQAAQEDAP